jgi:hypothetical protein
MPLCPAGFSSATWAELDPAPKKMSNIVVFCVFLYCKNTNLVFRIPGFRRNVTNIHIYQKKCFHAYGQYPNIF